MQPAPFPPSQVLDLFQRLRDEFADLEGVLTTEHAQTDVQLKWEAQATLPFSVHVHLDGDVLQLHAGESFTLEWFPCTSRDVVARFEEAVRGLLVGDHRVHEVRRRGRVVRSHLERWRDGRWQRIGTSYASCLPFWWGTRTHVLRREPNEASEATVGPAQATPTLELKDLPPALLVGSFVCGSEAAWPRASALAVVDHASDRGVPVLARITREHS